MNSSSVEFTIPYIYIYIFAGGPGVSDHAILVEGECIVSALVVLLSIPTFYDTESLGFPPRWVNYHPPGSSLVTASRFLAGNREAELNPPLSLHFYFSVFSCILIS